MYEKDNKSCPRCGDLVGYIVSTREIQVPYLMHKRYAKINTIYCSKCGLVYEEEDITSPDYDSSKQTNPKEVRDKIVERDKEILKTLNDP